MAVLLQETKHKINENGKLKRWYFFSFFKEFECKYHYCSESCSHCQSLWCGKGSCQV